MALPDPYVLGTRNFRRLVDGEYMDEATSLDAPSKLLFNRNIPANGGKTDYVVKRLQYKNSPTVGASDDWCEAYIVLRESRQGAFTDTEMQALASDVAGIVASTTVFPRIRRGER